VAGGKAHYFIGFNLYFCCDRSTIYLPDDHMASSVNLRNYLLISLLWSLCSIICHDLPAQNLESIGQEKQVNISGGVGLTSTVYTSHNIAHRRDPFTWIATANLNIDLYGWSIPLSFSYTNGQGRFQQPFNRYGLSPQYKWIKLYLGYHSLNYSAYTLSGHVFLGGGIALSPGKFRLEAMYGRFQKAVTYDSLSQGTNLPVYERRGMGTKVGYESSQGSVYAVLFYAADDTASLPAVPDSLAVFPAQNVALSLVASKQIGKRLHWKGEWASSLFTRDQASPLLSEHTDISPVSSGIIPIRQSSAQYQAWKTSATLNLGKGFLQGQYERVDPDYQTLGAYFFNNDLENIMLGIGWQFWKNRMQVNVQSGVQNNNLDQSKVSQTQRWVSNYSLSLQPAEQWQLMAAYSNLTSFTNIRPQADPFFTAEIDTLNFYQVNQNASLSTSYTFGNKTRQHAIALSNTYQLAKELQEQQVFSQSSYYYTNNLSYRISIVPLALSASLGGNLYYSILQDIRTRTFGPLLSLSKSFLEKKVRSAFSTGFNQVVSGTTATSRVLTARLSGSYQWEKSHRLSLNMSLLNNFPAGSKDAFAEWTTTARYAYSF